MVPLSANREWDRLPEEPLLWFQRFGSFLSLPSARRSLGAAYKLHTKITDPERYPTLSFSRAPDSWYNASEKWNWEQRAIAKDVADHESFLVGQDKLKEQVKLECQEALLTTLRKTMLTVEKHKPETMSLQGAVYAVPRIMSAIRDFFGFDEKQALTLETIMAALPAQLRSQVLANIRIGQVNITVNQSERGSSELLSSGEVVEGEVVEG